MGSWAWRQLACIMRPRIGTRVIVNMRGQIGQTAQIRRTTTRTMMKNLRVFLTIDDFELKSFATWPLNFILNVVVAFFVLFEWVLGTGDAMKYRQGAARMSCII